MRLGITCYPTCGESDAMARERVAAEKVAPRYEAHDRDVLEGRG